MDNVLIAARERAASRYPASIIDTMGREHIPAPRRAILAGSWDDSPLVGEAVKGVLREREEAQDE